MRFMTWAAVGLALLPTAAFAGETITYTYDAKGRLTNVSHAGGRNDGLTSTYTLDASDNRLESTVAHARSGVVVVPLNGLKLIPIG